MILQPGQDRKVVSRIECNQIDALPLDQRGNDALRRYPRDPGNAGNLICEIGCQGLLRRLHGEQARRDIHERGARDDDEVGAHAREAGRDPRFQRPACDEAGKADTHTEHDGSAQKGRAHRSAPDVLRCQPDQQPTTTSAATRLRPHPLPSKVLASPPPFACLLRAIMSRRS